MNFQAQVLLGRLRDTEKIHIRRANTDSEITYLYHEFKSELSGGHWRGGTEEEGIAEMRWVHAQLKDSFGPRLY